MQISIDTMFHIIGLIGTIIGVIWYVSNIISTLKTDLSNSNQLNSIQDKRIQELEARINDAYKNCRDGRVKIWEDVNASKLKIAKLEGINKQDTR